MKQKKNGNVCVVGSINMDLTVATNKIPAQGETVLGGEFVTNYGGKGANQAVAASRMGAHVYMIGAVGADAFGADIVTHLQAEGVETNNIETIHNQATGIANITLSEGDNRIIVASGANLSVTPALINRHEQIIKQSNTVLLQLEIPLETVIHTIELANKHDVPVVLNPAPYQPLPEETIAGATYITPNELELEAMKQQIEYEAIKHKIIVTRGSKGVEYYEGAQLQAIPSYPVEVRDTTGAGDTFNGVLAAMLTKQERIASAIHIANAAAGLSITKMGAQSGMPTYKEVQRFIEEREIYL